MWKIDLIYSVLFYAAILVQNNGIEAQSTEKKASKACSGYGYQVWLSCITDPCLFASCPAFGKLAECRKEISEDCKTCRAAFYLNGRRVNCHLRNFQCPPGLPQQQCERNPCTSTECMEPKFKGAQCRGYYCGGCLAEYLVDGRWQQCPNADVKLQGDAALLLPEIRRAMRDFSSEPQRRQQSASASGQDTCPDGTPEPQCSTDTCARAECPHFSRASCVVNKCQGCKPEFYFRGQLVNCQSRKCKQNVLEMSCPDDPCKYATCPLYPAAECRPSDCGYCHPEWFVSNRQVNCFSRMPDNYQCPNGLQQQQCPRNTCRFKRCLKDADTYCRVNNCGGCYAEYVNTQNEIVDCVGWWTKYENKKPKELLEANNTPAVNRMIETNTADSTLANPLPDTNLPRNTETKTSKDKEMEIDALFGNLGLIVPQNSEIVSSAVGSSPSVNNPWETPVMDNSQIGLTAPQTQLSLSQEQVQNIQPIIPNVKGSSAGNGPTKNTNKPREMSANTNTISKDTNKLELISANTNAIGMNTNKPGVMSSNTNTVGKDTNKPGVMSSNTNTVGKETNTRSGKTTSTRVEKRVTTDKSKLPEPIPINLFRSLAIPLDALDSDSNFRPGVPIGGWNFRSQRWQV